ncbi:hypothetical protein N657DRAFT_148092 [Parathielavia appendiculata]|uniref:Uncharacterized protein n=1 Tax=Parathielavia appendiculata TaxID=2587402 RepID=A0AAN6Z107_9PEZI|nr:hypothetical protein N657DRAFT_148092 [Parathielavia appendiculata]
MAGHATFVWAKARRCEERRGSITKTGAATQHRLGMVQNPSTRLSTAAFLSVAVQVTPNTQGRLPQPRHSRPSRSWRKGRMSHEHQKGRRNRNLVTSAQTSLNASIPT